MADHLLLLVLFSFFVSLVFAVLMRDEPGEQLKFGLLLFGGFIVAAVALSWLMYPFPL
jgi:heme/copper-type cytochrome/quinol oxidase subunit 4